MSIHTLGSPQNLATEMQHAALASSWGHFVTPATDFVIDEDKGQRLGKRLGVIMSHWNALY